MNALARFDPQAATFLVGCSKDKAPGRWQARDLYTGALFRRARAYVEAQGGRWFILSAAHGLLHPSQPLDAYDLPMRDLSAPKLEAWGARVRAALHVQGVTERPLIVLAGAVYRDALGLPADEIVAPMAGLGIGQQKAWLAARTPAGADL